MNKITKIVVGVMTAVVVLAGCGSNPVQGYQLAGNDTVAVCTDKTTGQRVADDRCDRNGGGMGNFFWYYLLASHMMPSYGQPVYGGSYTAPRNTHIYRGGISSKGGKINFAKPYKPFSTNVPKTQMKKQSWFSQKWGSSSNSGSKNSWFKSGSGSSSNSGTKKSGWGSGWGSSSRSGSGSGYKSGGYSGGGYRSGGFSSRR